MKDYRINVVNDSIDSPAPAGTVLFQVNPKVLDEKIFNLTRKDQALIFIKKELQRLIAENIAQLTKEFLCVKPAMDVKEGELDNYCKEYFNHKNYPLALQLLKETIDKM